MLSPGLADDYERPEAIDLSLVIPVLNEKDSLIGLQDEIDAAVAPLNCSWEVLWVDDGSTDGSAAVLEQLARERQGVRVIRLRRQFGKSTALRAGFERSRGAAVVTMDGDGQDDPAEIPALVEKLGEGYDVVSGWKQRRQDPKLKRWGSWVFNRFAARLSGVPLHDVNCGLKVYDGPSVRALEFYGEQHRLLPVLGFHQGWRIAEIPVHHRARAHGKSKFGSERYARGILDLIGVVLMGRSQHRPLHLFGGAGLLSGFLGLALGVYLSVERLSGQAIGTRPLLDLAVLLVLAGIQLFTVGLLAEMITATRHRVRTLGNTPDARELTPREDPRRR